MTFDYGPIANIAYDLIEEFGDPAVVRHPVEDSSDDVAGTVTHGTPDDVETFAVLDPINDKNFPGAVIVQGDKLAMVTKEVSPEDFLIFDPQADAVEWKVIAVQTIGPRYSEKIVWLAQVRR